MPTYDVISGHFEDGVPIIDNEYTHFGFEYIDIYVMTLAFSLLILLLLFCII
jgi:hypothetical protein